jgi:hypothetical protein
MSKKPAFLTIRMQRDMRRDFKRVAELRGVSVSEMINNYARQVIREERANHPKTFSRLPEPLRLVLDAVKSGCYELPDLVTETGLPAGRIKKILDELLSLNLIQQDKRGGKTSQARGAKATLWRPR